MGRDGYPIGDEDERDGPGLIDLDMKEFGSGTMSDPLRHAMGMRTAQDQCKMKMWNSFPTMFQNTIFHGEQDAEIKRLRHGGTLAEKLARSRELKNAGNELLKAATSSATTVPALPRDDQTQRASQEALRQKVKDLEDAVLCKEQELKELRRTLVAAKAELCDSSQETRATLPAPHKLDLNSPLRDTLEKATASYEKAAGLLRFVECVRPDWKNDDGSYKGIEDQHLVVDRSALEAPEAEGSEACDLVASCYLNCALAYQKMGDLEKSIGACTEVLEHINPKSVKAMYRRAQARTLLPSGLDADLEAAMADLQAAALLAPQDKDVRGLLARLRSEKRAQGVSSRSTFAGLFDRGSVVSGDPRLEGPKPAKLDINDPKVQAMLDIHPGPGGFGSVS